MQANVLPGFSCVPGKGVDEQDSLYRLLVTYEAKFITR